MKFSLIICLLGFGFFAAQAQNDQSNLCDLQALRLVESSPIVQNYKAELRDWEIEPSVLLMFSPNSDRQAKGTVINYYAFRLGINSANKFETITYFNFYPADGRLVQVDVTTGEESIISYDQKMLDQLRKACL